MIFLVTYFTFIIIFGVIMIGIYLSKYKNLPIDTYKPGASWTRALIYFSFCNIIITISGTLEQIITNPIFTLDQISNIYWVIYLIFCYSFIIFAYITITTLIPVIHITAVKMISPIMTLIWIVRVT